MNELGNAILAWATRKGWNSKVDPLNPSIFGEKIALMHSELTEALEEFRAGHAVDQVYFIDKINNNAAHMMRGLFEKDPGNNKPEGVPIELADCIIRILDFCAANDIDIDDAVNLKMRYNETRPYKHGGKVI